MPDGPWHAAVPVLAAAAAVTDRIRLGTLVATPNFRHPVTLAREALTLDDLSGGRLDLGLGPGSEGPDATALGQEPWTPAERLARFEEFLQVLQPIVDGEPAARDVHAHHALHRGRGAEHAGRTAAAAPAHHRGRRGQGPRTVATHGSSWVTVGPTGRGPGTPETMLEAVRRQLPLFESACDAAGRDPWSIDKVLLWTPTEPVITSLDQFDEIVGPYVELGFDQFVLHHPDQTGPYGGDVATFERIAERAAS